MKHRAVATATPSQIPCIFIRSDERERAGDHLSRGFAFPFKHADKGSLVAEDVVLLAQVSLFITVNSIFDQVLRCYFEQCVGNVSLKLLEMTLLHLYLQLVVAITAITPELKFESLIELLRIEDFDRVHDLISEHAIDWFESTVPADADIGKAGLHGVAKSSNDVTVEAWVLILSDC